MNNDRETKHFRSAKLPTGFGVMQIVQIDWSWQVWTQSLFLNGSKDPLIKAMITDYYHTALSVLIMQRAAALSANTHSQ